MAATAVRKAPYKDFLQPALQRRFASTATILLAVSYLEAVFLTQWSSFLWAWFPLGPAGFRTTLVFICGLAILVLRIAQYHLGLRTSGSGWQLLLSSVSSFHTYETAFWYGFSSLIFSHVFIWSTSSTAGLGWVTPFSGDRVRLNERTLYLVCYMTTCALVQTVVHYSRDLDRVVLKKTKKANDSDQQQKASSVSGSVVDVLAQLPEVGVRCLIQALHTVPVSFLLYFGLLRSTVWSWTLMFMRPFYNMPKTSIVPPSRPIDVYLFARCIYAGTLLCFIWASANTAFSAFMVKAPLKNGKPLTSESKDPNGSLLNGLKSKKHSIKCFAMWELALIAQDFDVRRQAIYDDIDRKDGPMWSQVYGICMDVIKGIETRVDNYGKPPAPAPEPPVEPQRRRITAPLRDDPISFNQMPARGGGEKAAGSTPASKLSPIVKKHLKSAKDRMLTKEQQDAMRPEQMRGQFEKMAVHFLNVDFVGPLFRHDFRTQFTATVLGVPYVEATLFTNAVNALSRLAVQSLKEDKFGNVHRDVASIVRTLTAIIVKVEALKQTFPAHWTDNTGLRDTPEVDEVLDSMRTGLEEVLAHFETYSSDLRLTSNDVRMAQDAMVKPVKAAPEKPKPKPKPKESVPWKSKESEPAKLKEKPREKAKEKESSRGSRRGFVANSTSPEMEQIR